MINQVTLVGRLTKDPDLRITPEGTPVVNLTLAVNRQFKNQHGEYDTDFVHCTIWRKPAENTANYCRKGSVVGITGKIHTRNYTNQEGKKIYVTEVVAETIQFLSKRPTDEQRNPVERSASLSEQKNSPGEWNRQNENKSISDEWKPSSSTTERGSGSTDDWMNIVRREKEATNVTAGGGIS